MSVEVRIVGPIGTEVKSVEDLPKELQELIGAIEAQFKANKQYNEQDKTQEERSYEEELKKCQEYCEIRRIASIDRAYYKALVEVGFTEEEALKILIGGK